VLPHMTARVPFIVEAAKVRAVVPLSRVTLPAVPEVANVTAPVRALVVVSKVMALSATSVVKLDVPPTVITPLSEMGLPAVTTRLRPTVTVPRLRLVVPLSRVTSPIPVVDTLTAPVRALVVVLKVMALSITSVVKLDVPNTVSAPD